MIMLLSSLALFSCKNSGTKEAEPAPSANTESEPVAERVFVEEPVFDINTTMGTIRIKLYKETPLHRDNFVKLATEKFYDGILFHRVIDGFMIQAGDPLTKDPANVGKYGTGGPGYTIPAEFNPALKHKKGAMAAARKGDSANPNKESSGSQFYLVQDAENCSRLDGAYTVFGETISGIDVIDKISAVKTTERDMPVEPVKILSVVEVVEQAEPAE